MKQIASVRHLWPAAAVLGLALSVYARADVYASKCVFEGTAIEGISLQVTQKTKDSGDHEDTLTFSGETQNHVPILSGKLECSNGQKLLIRADFKNGALDGALKLWYSDGTPKLIAEYRNGKPHGARKEFFEKGNLALEATYKKGELDGELTTYDPYESNRDKLTFVYKNGVKVSRDGSEFNEKSHINYVDGKPFDELRTTKDGRSTYAACATDENADDSDYCSRRGQISYNADKKVTRYSCGNGSDKPIRNPKIAAFCGFNGKPNTVVLYDEREGKKDRQITLLDGKMVGLETIYYGNGKTKQIQLIALNNRSRERASVYYNDQGQLASITCPSDSVKEEPFNRLCGFNGVSVITLFDRQGKRVKEARLLNGKLHGKYVDKNADGTPRREGNFVHGLPLGEQREFSPKGKPSSVYLYKKDAKQTVGRIDWPFPSIATGWHKSFNEDGTLTEFTEFKDRSQSSKTFYYMNGNRKRILAYTPGSNVVHARFFRDDDTLSAEADFVNERTQGVVKRYNVAGGLEIEENYTNGRLTALKRFNEDGSLGCTEEFFPDGSRKSKGPQAAKESKANCDAPPQLALEESEGDQNRPGAPNPYYYDSGY
jgi:YD repeat-containing protein